MSMTVDPLDSHHCLPASTFFEVPEEGVFEVENVHGEVPPFVQGTYYLNGPAKFQFPNGFHYKNWLDGDGMICALRFEGSRITLTKKFVRGKKWERENRPQDRRYNSLPFYRAFGTQFKGDALKRGVGTESPFNVSVIPYQNRLLAFGEQSLPMELDPFTLETTVPGRTFDFQRQLNDASPFSAHPKKDPRTGELFNFGVFFSPANPKLIYYRFSSHGKLACKEAIELEQAYSVHDFAVSENYVAFYLSPYLLDMAQLRKGASMMDSLHWEPTLGSQILVLDRQTGERLCETPTGGTGYSLHTVNAFEQGDALYLDLIEFPEPLYAQYQELPCLFENVPAGIPTRFEIASRSGLATAARIPSSVALDFPSVEEGRTSRCYDEFWSLGISTTGEVGPKFFDQLVHSVWATRDSSDLWSPPEGHFLAGEPRTIVDSESRVAVVICPLFDSALQTSYFALFNAECVSRGPIARLDVPSRLPLCFHSSFALSSDSSQGPIA